MKTVNARARIQICLISGALLIVFGPTLLGAEPPPPILPKPAPAPVVVPDINLFVFDQVAPRHQASTNQAAGLKQSSALEATGTPGAAETGSTAEFAVSRESDSLLNEADLQSFASMNGAPVLGQVLAPEPLGGAAGWVQQKVWDPVFAPEIVKLGKVYVSGGIVAAIKRKNPFCLLNPLVFIASW